MLCVRHLCQQKDNAGCRRVAHVIENEWRARMGIGTWQPQSNSVPDDRAERYLRADWVPYYYFIRRGEGGEDATEVMNRPSNPTFHFHVLPCSDALVIQGHRLSRLVFRKHLNRWSQVMYADTPPMVRPGLRASDDCVHTHALKDCHTFDDAEEICYLFVRDDRQTVWIHPSENFELKSNGSEWLPYVDAVGECVDCDRA